MRLRISLTAVCVMLSQSMSVEKLLLYLEVLESFSRALVRVVWGAALALPSPCRTVDTSGSMEWCLYSLNGEVFKS